MAVRQKALMLFRTLKESLMNTSLRASQVAGSPAHKLLRPKVELLDRKGNGRNMIHEQERKKGKEKTGDFSHRFFLLRNS